MDTLAFDDDLFTGGFAMVPVGVLRSPKLSSNAKTLYGILLSYARESEVAFPGEDTLAAHFGVNERTIRRMTDELKALGLLTTKRRGDGKNMEYHLRKMPVRPDKSVQRQAVRPDTVVHSETVRPDKNSRSENSDRTFLSFQTGHSCHFRPDKFVTPYKEEIDAEEIDADEVDTYTPLGSNEPSVSASLFDEPISQVENTQTAKPKASPLPKPESAESLLLRAYRRARYPNKDSTPSELEIKNYMPMVRPAVKDGVTPEQMEAATLTACATFSDKNMVNPRSVLRNIESLLEQNDARNNQADNRNNDRADSRAGNYSADRGSRPAGQFDGRRTAGYVGEKNGAARVGNVRQSAYPKASEIIDAGLAH